MTDTLETKLWWASVGGEPCEPVRVAIDRSFFYSIGCNDPHPLDGVVLVKEIEGHHKPFSPAESEARRQERLKEFERARKSGNLGYRRF
jgi:hypothetical protein